MALFDKKETKVKKATKKVAAPRAAREISDIAGELSGALVRPWLTEKALIGTEKSVYVFEVALTATKIDIALAVEKNYKVVPRQVRVVNVPGKTKALRSRRGTGTRSSRRKAYVYLTKGDSIQFA
jgi:large subunit ribosomal protein L23